MQVCWQLTGFPQTTTLKTLRAATGACKQLQATRKLFSGWPAFAVGIYDGQVRSVDPTPRTDGLFRILVEQAPGKTAWPERRFVRQGSKVLGWVQGDTVPVWYELWRQLNDFPLNFGQDQVAGKGEAKAPKDDKSSIEKKK